uniref:Uncharacterized protein n=1 Tax=Setaria viridis TaxID=4556 RepID=A0A4U6TVA8_SETVI|nr:hypothetical protein SEVIR_7G150303v2 [Setaria viridis]
MQKARNGRGEKLQTPPVTNRPPGGFRCCRPRLSLRLSASADVPRAAHLERAARPPRRRLSPLAFGSALSPPPRGHKRPRRAIPSPPDVAAPNPHAAPFGPSPSAGAPLPTWTPSIRRPAAPATCQAPAHTPGPPITAAVLAETAAQPNSLTPLPSGPHCQRHASTAVVLGK